LLNSKLRKECDDRQYSQMTAGKDWQFKCVSNVAKYITSGTIDYCLHTLYTTMPLLTNPAYFSDRDKISDYSVKALPIMMRYICRMLAHIYYHRRKLFDSLEYRYRIGERLTLYCKIFNIITNPKKYCIKI
jgi:hypothetical protein